MPDQYGNPTFKDIFDNPEVFKQLYNAFVPANAYSMGGAPSEPAPFQAQPAQKVPIPSTTQTSWDALRNAMQVASGGLTDAARIYQRAPVEGLGAKYLAMQQQQQIDREDAAQKARMFNAAQENQFGKSAIESQARMAQMQAKSNLDYLRMSALQREKASLAATKPGKVRVLTESDASGNPVNVAYQESIDEDGNTILKRIGLQQGAQTKTETSKPLYYDSVPTEGGGVARVPKTGTSAVGQVVAGPGGSPLMRQPPPGQVAQVAGDITTLHGIDEIWKGYKTLHNATGGDQPLFSMATAKRVLGTELGETKYGGKISPEYNKYITKRRLGLNRYIKGVTGAQFSIAELKRYEALFPQVTDDEDTARQKLSDIADQAVSDMQAYISAHGGLERMRNDPTEAWRFGPESGNLNIPTKPGQRIPSPQPPTPQQKARRRSLEDLANEGMK